MRHGGKREKKRNSKGITEEGRERIRGMEGGKEEGRETEIE